MLVVGEKIRNCGEIVEIQWEKPGILEKMGVAVGVVINYATCVSSKNYIEPVYTCWISQPPLIVFKLTMKE